MKKKKKSPSSLYAVIGLGRFGFALAAELAARGRDVLVVDKDRQKINSASEFTDNAYVISDLTAENLEAAGVSEADVAIIGIGDQIDVSILTTLTVLRLGVPRVIAKARSAEHGEILEKLGAEVVYPERDMALRLAGRLASPNIVEYISLSDDVDIMEISLTEKAAGKTVVDLGVRKNYGLNVIAFRHEGKLSTDITPTTVFCLGDTITVIGRGEDVEKFEAWLK